jgi:hypothetical protein
LTDIRHIDEDVVCGMTVQRCTQTLLIKVVTNETDAAAENEETIQCSNLDIFISFFWCESTAIA